MEDEKALRDAFKKKLDDSSSFKKMERYEKSGIPVFIKVDRYEDMLSIIDELKSFHSALSQVNSILDEIEKTRASAMGLAKKISGKIESRIEELNSFLVRPEGMKVEKKSKPARDIDSALSQLKQELEDLKLELGSINK